jgi:hypothetical protein
MIQAWSWRRCAAGIGCGVAAALALLAPAAAVAQSNGAVPNPYVTAFGAANEAAEIDVRVEDGVLPPHQDKAALAYASGRMPAEARAEWQAFVAGRVLNERTAAERMAEFLTLQLLRSRLATPAAAAAPAPAEETAPPPRRVRLAVVIDEGHAQSMMRTILVPGLPSRVFPKMAARFRIEDAATGALLASGRIRNSYSEGGDIKQARERLGLNYNPMGSDLHFQSLAGMSNAMAENLDLLLRSRAFPSGRQDLAKVWLPQLSSFHTIRIAYPDWDVAVEKAP